MHGIGKIVLFGLHLPGTRASAVAALGGGDKGEQMPPQIFLSPPPPPRWFQFAQTAYGFRQFQNMAYLLSVIISGFYPGFVMKL